MWGLFSRDPLKDFPYEIGDRIQEYEGRSIWTLYEGKKKTGGELASIFAFDMKSANDAQVQVAKASFKRIKTLRHPNMLTFLDGVETDKLIYIATEHVTPLQCHMHKNTSDASKRELEVSWGLHQIAKALGFLVNDCNLIHNNVCMSSVFVDTAGEWKLGGVDFVYPATGPESFPPLKIPGSLDLYSPPELSGGPARRVGEKWSVDAWGLGCLIWEAFNSTLPQKSSLKSLGKVPKSLVSNYCELVGANPKSRPNPINFIESCSKRGGFMDNKFVASMLFLEEIQIKDHQEKVAFFNSLSAVLDSFPPQLCKYRILPQLINAYQFGNAGNAVLGPMFKLGRLLDTAEYQEKIVPSVVKLFSSQDRATRVKLLQQMEYFVEHLTPPIVNDKIFPSVVSGFLDTNPVAMLFLAPKLNYKNLNEELLKHFARLQTKDDQGGIRTNTTVCLGKIAGYINPQMRMKVLSSAYLRAVKDPFPPARQAGVLAMAATQQYFTLQEAATRLLPCLCSMTLDPEPSVRIQVFSTIKCFMGKLEKVHENPESQEELEKEVLSCSGAAASTSGWANWAVSGVTSLTSKIRGAPKRPGSKSPSPAKQTDAPSGVKVEGSRDATPEAPPVERSAAPPVVSEATLEEPEGDQDDWGATDGWDGDDWGTMEETETGNGEVPDEGTGWDDDADWGSLEDTGPPEGQTESQGHTATSRPTEPSPWGSAGFKPTEGASVAGYNWGDPNDDSFFSSIISDKPATKSRLSSKSTLSSQQKASEPPAQKQTSQSQARHHSQSPAKDACQSAGGWDDGGDWGRADWGGQSSVSNVTSKADAAREKREQRKREMEAKRAARATSGGGAMKLGARKLAED